MRSEIKLYAQWARRWWKWLAVSLVVGLACGLAINMFQRPVYEATVVVLVSDGPGTNTYDYNAGLSSDRMVRSYAEMLIAQPVLEQVVAQQAPGVPVETFAKNLNAQVIRDTSLVKLSVRDVDPVQAATLANLIPSTFRLYHRTLQSERFAENRQHVLDQIAQIDSETYDILTQIDQLSASSGPVDPDDLSWLQYQSNRLRESRDDLLNVYDDLRSIEAQKMNSVIVVTPAAVPTQPILPRPFLNGLLGASVGLVLMIAGASLIEYLDDRLWLAEQVTALTELPVLGTVPRPQGGVSLSLPACDAEAYRALYLDLRRHGRCILVAGVAPGDDHRALFLKALALAAARAGRRVIVVDTDRMAGSLSEAFEQSPDAPGLGDYLSRESLSLAEVLQPLQAPRLRLLPRGSVSPGSDGLLESARMKSLMADLAQESDWVLMSAATVGSNAEVMTLAPYADGIVLLVESGDTRAPDVLAAARTLARSGARLVGAVMMTNPHGRP